MHPLAVVGWVLALELAPDVAWQVAVEAEVIAAAGLGGVEVAAPWAAATSAVLAAPSPRASAVSAVAALGSIDVPAAAAEAGCNAVALLGIGGAEHGLEPVAVLVEARTYYTITHVRAVSGRRRAAP